MDIKVLLGKKIQEIRKSKNLTQEKMAELLGIETSSLSNIERGKYYPTAEEVDEEIRKSFAAVQMVRIDIEHISGKKIHEK